MTEDNARRRAGMAREETVATIDEERIQLASLRSEVKAANNRIQRLEMDLLGLKEALGIER